MGPLRAWLNHRSGFSFRIMHEIAAIAFVRSHTTVPIPGIVGCQVDSNDSQIPMKCIHGSSLHSAWPNMNHPVQLNTVQVDINLFPASRLHPSIHGWIGSCSGECPRPELQPKYRMRPFDEFTVNPTHADFPYENIFEYEITGDITGLINWEIAGFWPEWWECRKALFDGQCQRWWLDIVNEVMPSH